MPSEPPHSDADLCDALPDPPPPRPARRDAAIDAALCRFDARAGPAAPTPPARLPAPRRKWSGAPQFAALASVMLVAVIAIPAWLSNDHRFGPPTPGTRATSDAIALAPAPAARATQDAPVATPAPARPSPAAPAAAIVADRNEAASDQVTAPSSIAQRSARGAAAPEPAYAPAPPPPPPPPPTPPAPPPPPPPPAIAATPAESRAAERIEDAGADIVVTSQRVRRKLVPRGDWNACTIEDPTRDLAACKRLVNPGAKGDAGRAAADIADGLSAGWAGDQDMAIDAFDRALAVSPGLSIAYLNRGLAYRRAGDLDRAIADLDQAVRLAPNAARNRYNRALVLRERGDARRARSDERDALALDSRYVAVIEEAGIE